MFLTSSSSQAEKCCKGQRSTFSLFSLFVLFFLKMHKHRCSSSSAAESVTDICRANSHGVVVIEGRAANQTACLAGRLRRPSQYLISTLPAVNERRQDFKVPQCRIKKTPSETQSFYFRVLPHVRAVERSGVGGGCGSFVTAGKTAGSFVWFWRHFDTSDERLIGAAEQNLSLETLEVGDGGGRGGEAFILGEV